MSEREKLARAKAEKLEWCFSNMMKGVRLVREEACDDRPEQR